MDNEQLTKQPEQFISEEEVIKALPPGTKGFNIPMLTETMNQALGVQTREDIQVIVDNMIGMIQILSEGKYKYDDYTRAVTYVTHKLMGRANIDCYRLSMPERYGRLYRKFEIENPGARDSEIRNKISPYVTAYNNNKLVNKLVEQSLIQDHILHAPIRHDAIMKLADLMVGADDDRDKVAAASALLVHLKTPETTKVQIDVNHNSEQVDALTRTIQELALKQQEHIRLNLSTPQEIAETALIEAEIVEK